MTDIAILQRVLDLFSNDEIWELQFADSIGVINAKSLTVETLEDEIIDCLSGYDIKRGDLRSIERHLEIEQLLEAKGHLHSNALLYLKVLDYNLGNKLRSFTGAVDRWKKSIELVRSLSRTMQRAPFSVENPEVKIKADILRNLRSFGYEFPMKIGRFSPTESDIARFQDSIRARFNRIGGAGLFFVLDNVSRTYDTDTERYLLQFPSPTIETKKPGIPWGYIFNVALSYLGNKESPSKGTFTKAVNQIVNIATTFYAALEFESFNRFAEIYKRSTESTQELIERIAFSQHFTIEQISISDVYALLSGLIEERGYDATDAERILLRIINWCLDNLTNERFNPGHSLHLGIRFRNNQLADALSPDFPREEVEEIINHLTLNVSELNSGYIHPIQTGNKNYYKYPFVKVNNDYFFLNANFFAKGFYLVWLKWLTDENPKNEGVVGKLFEGYFAKLLSSCNITFAHNVEYLLSREDRANLGIKAESAECDFIIESASTIYFIEIKKKGITGLSMSGNEVAALIDMSDSFLHGISQALLHEYCLRTHGVLKFKDSTMLFLNGRKVIKIHMSLFDHIGLQDSIVIEHFMRAVLKCQYTCSQQGAIDNFYKRQERFRAICSTPIINECYKDGKLSMTCRSLSLPFMLYLSKDIKCVEDFDKAISMLTHVSFGFHDLRQEYSAVKRISHSS